MKKQWNLKTTLIHTLSSLLGLFTVNCVVTTVEYGCPHADYIAKGTITKAGSGEPLANVQVYSSLDSNTARPFFDSTQSDSNGNYLIRHSGYGLDTMFLKFKTDSSSKDTFALFSNTPPVNGHGNWYEGVVEKKIDISL
jgi:putative lipoprotein (rSAM/lipoprotein system)